MKVKVYADVACPWCRLRVHQFRRAVAAAGTEREVELVHLPYQLDPEAPGEPTPLMQTMSETFSRDRANTMAAEMTRLGADEGAEYRFDRAVAANTFAAHRLLWFILREHGAGAQAALATVLYDAHFRDGVNVADHAKLAGLAERVGLDGVRVKGFLASGEGVAEVRERVAAARRGRLRADLRVRRRRATERRGGTGGPGTRYRRHGKEPILDRMMIRYRVKPDQVERHLELLDAVYRELKSTQPEGFRWATFGLEDGLSFVDFVAGENLPEPLPRLETFRRYRADLDERCDERVAVELSDVGSYRFD